MFFLKQSWWLVLFSIFVSDTEWFVLSPSHKIYIHQFLLVKSISLYLHTSSVQPTFFVVQPQIIPHSLVHVSAELLLKSPQRSQVFGYPNISQNSYPQYPNPYAPCIMNIYRQNWAIYLWDECWWIFQHHGSHLGKLLKSQTGWWFEPLWKIW